MLEIVQAIGAAAGVAAAVGVPLLSALHVSQSRDVRRLRRLAGRAPERSARPWHGRVGARHVAVVVVGLLVLGGAARMTGNDGGDKSRRVVPKKPKRKVAAVKPGSVTVAVLNGTTVPGLAASLGEQVAAAGFKKGTIDTFSDQQLAASVVQYAPGHRPAAVAVGRLVGISRRQPVSPDSRVIAPDATVIVIAGADKAPR